jgi:hypothetical protein
MPTLGDVNYSLPTADEWTNLAFLLFLFAPALGTGERLLLLGPALVLCGGSWAWHQREDVLGRRFDELGMMMVVSGVFLVLLYSAVGVSATAYVSLPLVAANVWLFYYNYLHQTDSFKHLAGWGAAILVVVSYTSGLTAYVPVALMSFGLWGQFSFPWNEDRYEHGTRHGLLWHVPVGLTLLSLFLI